MTLPVVVPDREPLTEAEARRIGLSAQRLLQLRDILNYAIKGATFTVQTVNGSAGFSLFRLEAQACLALLIEREEAFLTSFNVQLDRPLTP